MTREELISDAIRQGYAAEHEAREWCDKNPKDDYTVDDLIEIYRYGEDGYHIEPHRLKNRFKKG